MCQSSLLGLLRKRVFVKVKNNNQALPILHLSSALTNFRQNHTYWSRHVLQRLVLPPRTCETVVEMIEHLKWQVFIGCPFVTEKENVKLLFPLLKVLSTYPTFTSVHPSIDNPGWSLTSECLRALLKLIEDFLRIQRRITEHSIGSSWGGNQYNIWPSSIPRHEFESETKRRSERLWAVIPASGIKISQEGGSQWRLLSHQD